MLRLVEEHGTKVSVVRAHVRKSTCCALTPPDRSLRRPSQHWGLIGSKLNGRTGKHAASDGTTTSMYNEFGDSTTTLTDPLWHASVSSLGWRVDSRLGDLRPWAQISYNQQFGENIWKAQSGLSRMTATNQNGNWLDVTVGADMLLNQNIAAYAALTQAENTTNKSDYLYTMGVSARF